MGKYRSHNEVSSQRLQKNQSQKNLKEAKRSDRNERKSVGGDSNGESGGNSIRDVLAMLISDVNKYR